VLAASIIRAMMVNFYQTTRRNIPEDSHLHTSRLENLKSHNFGLVVILLCLVSEPQKQFSPRQEPTTAFWVCGLCFCSLLAEINNFDFGDILLSCLVSEVQKSFSPKTRTQEIFVVVAFAPVMFSLKPFWFSHRSSVVLNF
jgi:hypothetical protein